MTKRAHETGKRGGRNEAAILPSDLTATRRMGSDPRPAAAIPDPQKPLSEQDPAVLLAMCLFGEARGESDTARRAVAQVVLNRAKHPHPVFGSRAGAAWEENLRRVILRPSQFSALHPSDPNFSKLLRPHEAEDAAVWQRCLRCAEEALAARDEEDTLTANSDHYFDDSIQPPSWADPAKRTVKLGRLNFYRLYLPPLSAPMPSGAGPEAGSTDRMEERTPASSRLHPADTTPTQEPPEAEPPSAASSSHAKATDGKPSRALASDGRPSPVTGLLPARRGRSSLATSLPRRVPPCAWIPRLPQSERALRTGRLSSLWRGVGSREWGMGNRDEGAKNRVRGIGKSRTTPHSPFPSLHSLLPTPYSLLPVVLLAFCLLLAGCNEFERTAYRTLAVTQAEYETIQTRVAEAAAHGLITEEQWNRFSAEGHRFLNAHNAAVDAFELWSRVKSAPNAARVEALLEILPRLVRELNSLAESFQSEPRPEGSGEKEVRSQKSGVRMKTPQSETTSICRFGGTEESSGFGRESRSLAEFTLSGRKSRSFAALRMTSEGLGMTCIRFSLRLLSPVS